MPRPKKQNQRKPKLQQKRPYNGPFTIPALTRIARKAGIKSITPAACIELRTNSYNLLKDVVLQAKGHKERISEARKTLMKEDVDIVLQERGVVMANSCRKRLARYKFKTFERYISSIIKTKDSKIQISKDAQSQLNSFIYELAHGIVRRARNAAHQNNKITTSLRHIEIALNLILGPKLAEGALKKVKEALSNYDKSLAAEKKETKGDKKKDEKKGIKMTQRTGLHLPPSRMTQFFKTSKRTSIKSRIALTAGVEYVLTELLEEAKKAAQDKSKTRIFSKYLKVAVSRNEELKCLISRKLKFKFVRVPTADIQIEDTTRDNATRQVKRQQRSEDNAMRRMPFERLVRELTGSDLRVSACAIDDLMDYIENTLYDILLLSKDLADHAKRSRVNPDDIGLAFRTSLRLSLVC